MLKLKNILFALLPFVLGCGLFPSSKKATDTILAIGAPPYIQPANVTFLVDQNGALNFKVGIQLMNYNGYPIKYQATSIFITMSGLDYKDANGNVHYSKPFGFGAPISQTLDYPTADGSNIIQSLQLLPKYISNSFVTTPDQQTGDYDRYQITVYLGYEVVYPTQRQASLGYGPGISLETQYNDFLEINAPPDPYTGRKTVADFSKQFCIGHRNYYFQPTDGFNNPLTPYPDNITRW